MPAYLIVYPIAEYSLRNSENAKAFRDQFGITPRVIYGNVEALEGTTPDGVVVLEFPTMEAARGWYNSEAYQEALRFRQRAAEWRVVLVEGMN